MLFSSFSGGSFYLECDFFEVDFNFKLRLAFFVDFSSFEADFPNNYIALSIDGDFLLDNAEFVNYFFLLILLVKLTFEKHVLLSFFMEGLDGNTFLELF